MAVAEAEAEAELLYDVVAHSALAEILHSDGAPVDVVVQDVLEIVGCPLVYDEHRLPVRLLFLLLLGEFLFLYLDVVAVGKPAQGVGVGELLVFHEESHAVAAFAAYEAVAGAPCRRDVERRGVVVMEGAQAAIVYAHLLERHKFGDDIHDVGSLFYAFYGDAVNHLLFIVHS